MKILSILSRNGLPLSVLDLTTWPKLEASLLQPTAADRYERFHKAITRVVRDHATISAAARDAGIDRSELGRALERCLETTTDGGIQGWQALIPHRRVKPYRRRANTRSGTAGLLEELLNRFPAIVEKLHEAHSQGKSLKDIKQLLLDKLLPEVHWPRHLYPYNTVTKAREALRVYFQRVDTLKRDAEWEAQVDGSKKRVIVRPFEQVQFDAHRCDAHFVIHIEGPEGLSRTVVIERIWLLVLLDVASRAVLGYALSLNRQCNISDVLEAIHTAIVPQSRRELTIPGLDYLPGAGFPNQLIPACAWQRFDLIALDNAMAHRSARLHEILNERIQCVVKLNRAGKPNDNTFIERFFGTITAHGFKRTPSTTGSGPDDPSRKDSEGLAEFYEFNLGDAEELLDVLLANSNIEGHRGIYTSPLDYLQRYYRETPALMRNISVAKRSGWTLRELWDTATVRGSVDEGKRPYVQYLGAHYCGDFLGCSSELIGKELLLLLNLVDMRSIKAYLPDGRVLGELRATGRWSLTKHTLKSRRLIIQLVREDELHIGYQDPVRALVNYLEQKAKQFKWARNQLARVQREMQEAPSDADQLVAAPAPQVDLPNRDDWVALRTPVYD